MKSRRGNLKMKSKIDANYEKKSKAKKVKKEARFIKA